ncbi:MAG: GIN domain-containing protein [Prevotella sp.]
MKRDMRPSSHRIVTLAAHVTLLGHILNIVPAVMLCILVLSPVPACAGGDVMTTREVKVGRFGGLWLSSIVKVEYSHGSAYTVRVVAKEKGQEYIKVEEKRGTLHIYAETPKRQLAGITYNTNDNALNGAKVYVTSPSLASLRAESAAEFATADNLDGDSLDVTLSGCAAVSMKGRVSMKSFSLRASGAATARFASISSPVSSISAIGISSLHVDGIMSDHLLTDIKGAGTIELRNIESDDVLVQAEGTGRIAFDMLKADKAVFAAQGTTEIRGEVNVMNLLECHATGCSKIRLKGKANNLKETHARLAEVTAPGDVIKTDTSAIDMTP